jgi:hypothetical protein
LAWNLSVWIFTAVNGTPGYNAAARVAAHAFFRRNDTDFGVTAYPEVEPTTVMPDVAA